MRGEIREARLDDVPSLEIVRRQAIEAGLSDAYDRAGFADLVANPEGSLETWIREGRYSVLVLETDVTPACFGSFDRESGRIHALYTAPDYERSGCASALLARFEELALEDDLARIRVTAPKNAVGFFEANGFDRRGSGVWQGLEAVTLERRLG